MNKKKITTIAIMLLFDLALLAYTGYRTYDLLASTVPVNGKLFAFLGVAAFDGGFIIWTLVYLMLAENEEQELVAALLAGIDFLGVAITGIGDMILRQTLVEYTIPDNVALAIIYGLPVIIMANIFAGFWFHAMNQDMRDARINRKLQSAAIKAAHKSLLATLEDDAEQRAVAIASKLQDDASTALGKTYKGLVQPVNQKDDEVNPT